jgi:hypothetical protein
VPVTEPSISELMFDPTAAGALARRAGRAGAAFGAVAGRLNGLPAGGADPWRVDAALVTATDAACARLLAVAAEFDLVAFALRAAVVSYRAADDRTAARFAGLAGAAPTGWPAPLGSPRRPGPAPAGGGRAW